MKAINELVGTNIHHDTITGTSPSHVITNETNTVIAKALMNSKLLGNAFKQKAIDEQGIAVDNLEQCLHQVNDRHLCPKEMRLGDHEVLSVVYNPSINS
jgi:maltodextrin utilization protein YvdJ